MKYVFNNSDAIGHLWAHQTQSHATAGNVSFRDSQFRSYNTTVACIVAGRNGERVYLLTNYTYSPSTSKHQSIARRAIPAGSHSFYVPVSRGNWSYPEVDTNHSHNVQLWADEIRQTLKDAQDAREPKKTRLILEAESTLASAREYRKYFKVTDKLPTLPYSRAELAAMREQFERQQTQRRDAAQRAADVRRANRDAAWQARNAAYAAEQAMTREERISKWLSGGRVYSLPYDVPAMLRVNGDTVETSKGASFPVAHAAKGLRLVDAVVAKGEEWKRNGHTCHLGHYQIDRIEPNGTVYAGCHVVSLEAINRIRPQLTS